MLKIQSVLNISLLKYQYLKNIHYPRSKPKAYNTEQNTIPELTPKSRQAQEEDSYFKNLFVLQLWAYNVFKIS